MICVVFLHSLCLLLHLMVYRYLLLPLLYFLRYHTFPLLHLTLILILILMNHLNFSLGVFPLLDFYLIYVLLLSLLFFYLHILQLLCQFQGLCAGLSHVLTRKDALETSRHSGLVARWRE